MEKQYSFFSLGKGGKTTITIKDGTLTISRPGIISKFSHGFVGEKTILISNISAVQLKKAGMARGYIQFIMPGTVERKSGIVSGSINENTVYFDSTTGKSSKANTYAEEIKAYIENYNLQNNNANISNQTQKNKYDELKQLKELLDNGIITQEEFDKEKVKLLN